MDSPAPVDKDYIAEWLNTNHETPSESDCDIPDAHGNFASRFYHCCVANFRDFCQFRERQTGTEISKSNVKDELARLYMWGEYFKDGELDIALAPSEELASKVISLLSGIGKRLLRYFASNEPNELTPGFLETSELPSFIEQAEVIVSGPSGEELSNADDWDDEDGSDSESTSIQEEAEFCEDVEFNTRCLMQLIPALEQNIVSSRTPRIRLDQPTSQTFSVSEPASTYISLAQQRFQDADLKLVQRLGEANWQRHVRLRKELYGHEDGHNEPSAPVACSIFHDSGLGTTVAGSSQYAPSLASHASFASSVGNEESPFLRVPPMPPEVIAGQKFVCALCGTTQSRIRNRIEWKMHVFSDLKPYICTFPECSLELVQFSTRAQWADHEFSCHRFIEDWCCPFCSTRDIHNRQGCEQHLERSHDLKHPEIAYWANRARTKRARMMNVEECLLCRTFPAESRQAFIKHCCRHMEEIALMAMPEIADDGSEGDENNPDDDRSTQSSGHSAYISLSKDTQPSRHEADAPTVAPMKHTGSTMTEVPFFVHPGQSIPMMGDATQLRSDAALMLPANPIEKKPHKCPLCGGLFSSSYNFNRHLETHAADRKCPHPCTAMNGDKACTKEFQRKTDLDRHYNSVHLKARNHRCNLCGNRFARRDTLRRHNEDGCPKRFEWKDPLAARDRQASDTAKSNAIDPSYMDEEDFRLRPKSRAAPLGRCYSCNTGHTTRWHPGPDGDGTLCDECGTHFAMLIGKSANGDVTGPSD